MHAHTLSNLILGMGEGKIKENDGGAEPKYDIFNIL
jgi:hypothetical protein